MTSSNRSAENAFHEADLQVNPTGPHRVDVHISADPAALLLVLYRRQSQ